jgi:hypothetical protein
MPAQPCLPWKPTARMAWAGQPAANSFLCHHEASGDFHGEERSDPRVKRPRACAAISLIVRASLETTSHRLR